jgi:hypothetical protein
LTAYRLEAKLGDPFQDKFYLSFVDRKTNLTWYHRNHTKVDALLDSVFGCNTTQPIEFKAPVKPHLQGVANPIPTNGKQLAQEMGNTSIQYTERTTERTSKAAEEKQASAALRKLVVVDNEQDEVLLSLLVSTHGGGKIEFFAKKLIGDGKRPYLSSIKKLIEADVKKQAKNQTSLSIQPDLKIDKVANLAKLRASKAKGLGL